MRTFKPTHTQSGLRNNAFTVENRGLPVVNTKKGRSGGKTNLFVSKNTKTSNTPQTLNVNTGTTSIVNTGTKTSVSPFSGSVNTLDVSAQQSYSGKQPDDPATAQFNPAYTSPAVVDIKTPVVKDVAPQVNKHKKDKAETLDQVKTVAITTAVTVVVGALIRQIL